MMKKQRSNKWTFLLYADSVLKNYINILDELHIPYVLSPWHDKDIDKETGEFKKAHRHGALYFDSLKSYEQVSKLLTEKLNAPAHVEAVLSPKGLYDYFTHADNPEKTPYDIKDIVSGCGFELEKFILENSHEDYFSIAIDVINENNFTEFGSFVNYARENDPLLLKIIVQKPYFFSKLLDSLRYNRFKVEKEIHQKNKEKFEKEERQQQERSKNIKQIIEKAKKEKEQDNKKYLSQLNTFIQEQKRNGGRDR